MSDQKSIFTNVLDNDLEFYQKNSFISRAMATIAAEESQKEAEKPAYQILMGVLEDHERSLVIKLNQEPLLQMAKLLKEAPEVIKKSGKVWIEKSPVYFRNYLPSDKKRDPYESYSNPGLALKSVHRDLSIIWNAYKNDKRKINVFFELYDRYVPAAAGLTLITWLKRSPNREKCSALLLCISALIKLDQLKLYNLFRSEAYEDYAARKKGKRHSDKQLEALKALENELKDKANDLWKKGDKRWHSQMARDLTPIINAPAIAKIEKELSERYPSRETDEKENKAYIKEYKNKMKYETLSIGRATEILYDEAKTHKRQRGKKNNKENTWQINFTTPDFYTPFSEDD